MKNETEAETEFKDVAITLPPELQAELEAAIDAADNEVAEPADVFFARLKRSG